MMLLPQSIKDSIIFQAWCLNQDKIYMSQDEFINSFEGWQAYSTDDHAFVAFFKGPEFHFQALKEGSSLSMKSIKKFLEIIINKEGFAITRTPKDDLRQQRFNELIGFFRISETEFDVIYKIERVKCRSLQ